MYNQNFQNQEWVDPNNHGYVQDPSNLQSQNVVNPVSYSSNPHISYPREWDSYDLSSRIFSLMVENRASDCYPVVDYPLWIKIDWKISWVERLWVLSREDVVELLNVVLSDEQKKVFESEKEIDFAYEWVDENWVHSRFRINAFHQWKKPSATIRYLRNDIKTIDDIWLPGIIRKLSERNSWIVLICWVTGSWKSTTAATMINHINNNFSKHIISIEDPVEYTFDRKKSWIEQREVWTDTHSFAKAMKSALRQNPNVLFLWEMRDLESISSAITIAESWHLVISTIHARNSVQCLNKIIDSFPASQQNQIRVQLAEALGWVVTQKLIPRTNWKWLRLVMEVMVNNTAVWNLIRENKIYQIESIIQTWGESWMFLLDDDIINALANGEISPENAIKYSNNPVDMEKKVRDSWLIE